MGLGLHLKTKRLRTKGGKTIIIWSKLQTDPWQQKNQKCFVPDLQGMSEKVVLGSPVSRTTSSEIVCMLAASQTFTGED